MTLHASTGRLTNSNVLHSPMRFPVSYTVDNETLVIQDHKLVFQLADELNVMNKAEDESYQVNFIKWINSNPNTYQFTSGVRKTDGTVPRRSEYGEVIAALNRTTIADESEAHAQAEANLEACKRVLLGVCLRFV